MAEVRAKLQERIAALMRRQEEMLGAQAEMQASLAGVGRDVEHTRGQVGQVGRARAAGHGWPPRQLAGTHRQGRGAGGHTSEMLEHQTAHAVGMGGRPPPCRRPVCRPRRSTLWSWTWRPAWLRWASTSGTPTTASTSSARPSGGCPARRRAARLRWQHWLAVRHRCRQCPVLLTVPACLPSGCRSELMAGSNIPSKTELIEYTQQHPVWAAAAAEQRLQVGSRGPGFAA